MPFRQQLISLLEDHFFPKWRAVLQHWLAHNPDYDEVTAWYLGWKVSGSCVGLPRACSMLKPSVLVLLSARSQKELQHGCRAESWGGRGRSSKCRALLHM